MLARKCSPNSWNTYLRQIKSVCNFAVEHGYMQSHNFSSNLFLKSVRGARKTIDDALLLEAIAVLENGKLANYGPPWFWIGFINFLFKTGIRRRQINELQWRDVDFNRGTILLRSESSKNGDERELPLGYLVDEVLHLYNETAKEIGAVNPKSQVFNSNVFKNIKSRKHNKMTLGQIDNFFQNLSKHLSSGRISPHRLRHAFATRISKHTDLFTLKEIMGHSSISTTARYVHPSLGRMSKAMYREKKK